MSTTDGTAAFEKRKFADNSKLSMPSSYVYSSTSYEVIGDSETWNMIEDTFVAPADGYARITCTIGTADVSTGLDVQFPNDGQRISIDFASKTLGDWKAVFIPI